jgi:hypothetical protein
MSQLKPAESSGNSRPTSEGHAAQLIASEQPLNSCVKLGASGAKEDGRPFE